VTGAETEAGTERRSKGGRRKRDAASGPTDVGLEHSRWRALSWTVAGLIVGLVLVIKLGSVGKAVGIILCLASLLPARNFIMTLLHAPGRIRVDDAEVSLPRGLCRSGPVTLPRTEVRHAYFLRRAVPWTRTGPLLIIETAKGVFQYPRDWFATDSDQRRVAAALNRQPGHS